MWGGRANVMDVISLDNPNAIPVKGKDHGSVNSTMANLASGAFDYLSYCKSSHVTHLQVIGNFNMNSNGTTVAQTLLDNVSHCRASPAITPQLAEPRQMALRGRSHGKVD